MLHHLDYNHEGREGEGERESLRERERVIVMKVNESVTLCKTACPCPYSTIASFVFWQCRVYQKIPVATYSQCGWSMQASYSASFIYIYCGLRCVQCSNSLLLTGTQCYANLPS